MTGIYSHTVEAYQRGLGAMLKWLDKAVAFAEQKKFDVDTLVSARLAPDMHPFGKQVQMVCDCAKGQPALLCGKEAPKHEDREKTFGELRQRIEATLTYLATLKPEDFESSATRRVPLPIGADRWMVGGAFVDQIANPNFYFHASMAYAILRHNGVDLGKRDFLGELDIRQG